MSQLEAHMGPVDGVRDNTPENVDMRKFLWPVESLGEIVASAASAAVTALEYHCNRIGVEPTDLSSMFVHYNARLLSGQEGLNAGTTVEAALKAIALHGACREASWPFDPAKIAIKPPAQAYEEAKKFAGIQYYGPTDIVESLALNYPVAFVAKLPFRCLREAGQTGVMPAPTSEERQNDKELVNHAMVAVGYDKVAKTFVARNCFGKEWGDQGYCTISFEIMKVIVPNVTGRLWVIAKPAGATDVTMPTGAEPIAETTASAAQPERLADLAAKMRQEIRSDLQRDIADASKRIQDMMRRNPGGKPGER
jgi:hypothetical protein